MSDFKVAIVVDMQEDFADPNGALYVKGGENVTEVINQYLESIELENGYMGVIFTADTHDAETYEDSLEAKGDPSNGIPAFPPHCIMGTDGFKFSIDPSKVPERTPKLILNKGVFSMWEEQDLALRPYKVQGEEVSHGGEQERDAFFQNLLDVGCDTIEVVGLAADYCVKYAIEGLVVRGFNVVTYDNLTAGISRDIHQVVADDFPKNVTVL